MSQPLRLRLRLGLCCQFAREPIKFRTTTATAMLRLARAERLARLAQLCRANVDALLASLHYCATHGIGAFRINSQILPLKTHPEAGYEMAELPGSREISRQFRKYGAFARKRDVRLFFHPGQFVVLNSPNERALAHSPAGLDYQEQVAEWVGADTINLHDPVVQRGHEPTAVGGGDGRTPSTPRAPSPLPRGPPASRRERARRCRPVRKRRWTPRS